MKAMFNGKPLFGPRGPAGPDGAPIGTVISYLGLTAPEDYLVCDGSEYAISDYSKLAEFFKKQFGVSNYFGGDGEETFAVPDMRNLFLRGYHGEAEEQLSGEVGKKQSATEHPAFSVGADGVISSTNRGDIVQTVNPDSISVLGTASTWTPRGGSVGTNNPELITSRPVNMAVLYCIKAVVSDPYEDIYSTNETVIGTWIDGKPVYRTCIMLTFTANYGASNKIGADLSDCNIDTCIQICGYAVASDIYPDKFYPLSSLWVNIHYDGREKYLYGIQGIDNSPVLFSGCIILEYTKTTDQGVSG